jgi:hypothetical protein
MRKVLEAEYIAETGSDEPTTQTRYTQVFCKSIAKRLQSTCGLSTKMKLSIDGDEIICTIRADTGDLQIEADRSNYRMQTHNVPFMTR